MKSSAEGPHSVDLRQVLGSDAGWLAQDIPGGSQPVRLHRLHLDRASKASVSLVEFPPGWSRDISGSYAVAEEFVVLRGALEMNGLRHQVGEWVFVPGDARREATRTPEGALALAWFGGIPTWQPGFFDDARRIAAQSIDGAGVLKEPSPEHAGTKVCSGQLDPSVRARDLLVCDAWTWTWLPAGTTLGNDAERVVVRSW